MLSHPLMCGHYIPRLQQYAFILPLLCLLYSAVYYKRGPFHFRQSSLEACICMCIICSSISSVLSRIILELIAVHLVILLVSYSEIINPIPSFAFVFLSTPEYLGT
jgi:hypothetical protein